MTSSSPSSLPNESARLARWGLGAIALASLIGLLAALLPARARLIGLFGPAEGALLCLLLVEVLRRMQLKATQFAFVTALLCGSTAFTLTSVVWWKQFAESVRIEYRVPPPNFFAGQLATSTHPVDAEKLQQMKLLQESFENDPEREKELAARCSLPGYLVFRVYGVSNAERLRSKQFAAIAFWVCELIASGLTCGILFHRATGDVPREPLASTTTA